MRLVSERNGPERAGRRPPITGGASMKRCVRALGLPARQRRARAEGTETRGQHVRTRRVSLALAMAVAILGTHAHADVPRAPILWAFEEGQTRIRLQWNRRGDEVIDHKIEVCAELAAGDCDDWTVLVADHPEELSSTRSNMYKHEGRPAGSTRHYRVSSRNDDQFHGTRSGMRGCVMVGGSNGGPGPGVRQTGLHKSRIRKYLR